MNTKLSKSTTLGTKLYSITPIPKPKVIPKVVEKNDLSKTITSQLTTNKIIEKCTKVLAQCLLKIESEPINTYFKNNKDVDRDYLKVTKEHVARLHELLEETRALKPLDEFKNYCNANVNNVALSKNSDTIFISCNECLFSANHDACVVKYLKDVQKCKKAKSVKQKEKKQWKPTGRVFTSVGLRWKPTGRMFNMEGKIIQTSPATIVPPGNRLHTIRIPAVAPSTETRMRYSIAKNSLLRDHINSYGHPFNSPNFSLERNSVIPEQSSWNFGFLGCSKHMTGHRDKLINFVSKFIGLGNNLFSVGQFCDSDLEVAFRIHTCFVRNLEGVDLLLRSRGSNLYTISMADMMNSSPICLLSKASNTKSWLWYHRLSHLNFATINQLAKQGLVKGLPKLKYTKDHLCSACQKGKSKKESHPHKPKPSTNEKLQMLHMDLCGPMRVESINKKRYILVIVDDYSRFTWVKSLRTKDEAPEIIIKILKQAQVSLNATVRYLCTDNGTEFINQTLRNYKEEVEIIHHTSTARTPQQNGVVKRRNHTLVEAARTMLIFSKSLLFLWAKVVATAYRKPELKYLHVFGALCYPTNDFEDLGKLQPKADIGIFIGYSPSKKASGLVLYQAASTSAKKNDWDLLFQPMFDEYFKPPSVVSTLISAATLTPLDTARASSSTSIDKDAPYPSTSPNNETTTSPINSTNVEPNEEVTVFDTDTFINPFAPPVTSSAQSSSRIVDTSNMHTFQQPQINTKRWTRDHPLVTIIDNPSKPVSTRR
ncbi:retrovirus-related pol polyprotein from transposon TNT 1-94 [Tanacetum coccineum]